MITGEEQLARAISESLESHSDNLALLVSAVFRANVTRQGGVYAEVNCPGHELERIIEESGGHWQCRCLAEVEERDPQLNQIIRGRLADIILEAGSGCHPGLFELILAEIEPYDMTLSRFAEGVRKGTVIGTIDLNQGNLIQIRYDGRVPDSMSEQNTP